MLARALWVGLALALVAADDEADRTAKQDLERMHGTWVAVRYVVAGKSAADQDLGRIELTVKGTRSAITRFGEKFMGRYRLDAGKTPKQLDILLDDGPNKGQKYLSIYEFDGGTLKICRAEVGKPRPTSFESTAENGQVLEVWKKK